MASFKAGDRVRITKKIRVENVGWNSRMDKFIGTDSVVKYLESNKGTTFCRLENNVLGYPFESLTLINNKTKKYK